MSERNQVRVRVPASTSNCGPGFDCLGIGLSLHNEVTVEWDGHRPAGAISNPAGEGEEHGLTLARRAADAFFAATGREARGFRFSVQGQVPPARGLGSSVTLLGGIVAGLDLLTGAGLGRDGWVRLVAAIEGHPDNAAASLLGGFCVARMDPDLGGYAGCRQIPVPAELRFVAAIPAQRVLTREARGVLPGAISHADATRTAGSLAWLVASVAAGDWAALRWSTQDFLHQPYRLPRQPAGAATLAAGLAAGSWGGWLSGSGSTVLCPAPADRAGTVAAAMEAALVQFEPGQVLVLQADAAGLVPLAS